MVNNKKKAIQVSKCLLVLYTKPLAKVSG